MVPSGPELRPEPRRNHGRRPGPVGPVGLWTLEVSTSLRVRPEPRKD